MRHPEIEEHEVVEHYVAGKLTADEEARFEEHYLDCPACIRAVEDAERLHRGLMTVAAESVAAAEVALRGTVLAAFWRVLRSGRGRLLATTVLAAVLAVALFPAVVTWQRAGRLGDELDATRRELADERRPRINTPVLAFAPTRAGEPPLQQVSLRPEPEWIVLAIELGDEAGERYAATLADADGDVVWTSPDLVPSYIGTVTLSFHSSLLPPGDYVLSLEDSVRDEPRELRFPLRVVVRTP